MRLSDTAKGALLGTIGGMAAGATLEYFMDPQAGRRRRAMLTDRSGAVARRTTRGVSGGSSRFARRRAGEMAGMAASVRHGGEATKEGLSDETIRDKVQSELFRDADVPKGDIVIGVADGVVTLRGEVASAALIERLGSQAAAIQGVSKVENLLHLPGSTAPSGTA
jgi:osmotically-inducible protein OsmY